MRLKVLSKEVEKKGEEEYAYELHYFKVKFLGEVFEVTKENLPFVDIMQFWFERKASRNCWNWFRKYPNSLKWKFKAKFWSKLEWYWRKFYQYNRQKRG